ncbi:CocE/NonD family hydrolase [Nocardioides sp.]|uniref:CocE/NonD family hydrolase n=1 Tax=Nocardioides sp. TaxID=35761 RepID=UPI003D0F78D0
MMVKAPAETAETTVSVRSGIRATMRDGTVLVADLFLPVGPGPFPTVLIRTAYGRHSLTHTEPGWSLDPLAAARAGYAVVVQDGRGTADSDGHFVEFMDEANDGEDTIAWVAAQPWSDGSVGMVGVSYLGITQLLAASKAPLALKAVVPGITASEAYDGWTYQGGAFNLGLALSWGVGRALARLDRLEQRGQNTERERRRVMAIFEDPDRAFGTLPLDALPVGIPSMSTYADWLAHPSRDDYWARGSVNDRYEDVDVPALHIGGLYDCFLKGTLENYVGLRSRAATEFARENQRLVLVPWGHVTAPMTRVGDLWLGPQASAEAAAVPEQTMNWMDQFVRRAAAEERARVTVFVLGDNKWRTSSDWPLPEAVPMRWYLNEGGHLSQESPGREALTEFTYDPRDPVPSLGGSSRISLGGRELEMGPRDRSQLQQRPDVIVFTSRVLEDDLEAVGPVSLSLWVTSSAPDTDFTATLVDVFPDGRAIGISDGILRMRYRNTFAQPELMTPGVHYQIEIDLVAVANVFKAGHRLQIEISSSNFPRFDRNPNSGGQIASATMEDLRVAQQKVYHGAAKRSFLTLPRVLDQRLARP